MYSGVTTKGFEGCIKDIALGGAYRNINDYKTVKNVEQGCVPVRLFYQIFLYLFAHCYSLKNFMIVNIHSLFSINKIYNFLVFESHMIL